MADKKCLFCKWIKERTRVVYETPMNMVIQPNITYNPYCLLVVPKKHYTNTNEMPRIERDFLYKETHYLGSKLEGKLGINSVRYVQNSNLWTVSQSPLSVPHVHYNIFPVFDKPYDITQDNRKEFGEEELSRVRTELTKLFGGTERKIYVIEGVNGCGKDTVLSLLNDRLIDSTEIKIHGFYYRLSQRVKTRTAMMDYNHEKLLNFNRLFAENLQEDFIVSRFHLSDMVFSDLLWGEHTDYSELEEELDTLGATLVLLDVPNKDILLERLKGRFTDREVVTTDISPHMEKDTIWGTREEYLKKFQKSKLKNKCLVNTVALSADEVVEEILKC